MTPVDWRSPALFRFGERTAGTASTTPPLRPEHRRFASGNRSDSGSATLPTIASNRTTDVSWPTSNQPTCTCVRCGP